MAIRAKNGPADITPGSNGSETEENGNGTNGNGGNGTTTNGGNGKGSEGRNISWKGVVVLILGLLGLLILLGIFNELREMNAPKEVGKDDPTVEELSWGRRNNDLLGSIDSGIGKLVEYLQSKDKKAPFKSESQVGPQPKSKGFRIPYDENITVRDVRQYSTGDVCCGKLDIADSYLRIIATPGPNDDMKSDETEKIILRIPAVKKGHPCYEMWGELPEKFVTGGKEGMSMTLMIKRNYQLNLELEPGMRVPWKYRENVYVVETEKGYEIVVPIDRLGVREVEVRVEDFKPREGEIIPKGN